MERLMIEDDGWDLQEFYKLRRRLDQHKARYWQPEVNDTLVGVLMGTRVQQGGYNQNKCL
jgi:hypothetical protein